MSTPSRAVDAGGGTAADFAGLDVKGKVAVVALGATERATVRAGQRDQGRGGLPDRLPQDPRLWIEAVDRATSVPLMIATTGEQGAALGSLLKTGKKGSIR
ncbi:hypothetical protein ACRAWF_43405 [Streptomyces sp. L7]